MTNEKEGVGYTLRKAGNGHGKIMTVRKGLWERILIAPRYIREDIIGIWITYLKRHVGLTVYLDHKQEQEWLEVNTNLETPLTNSLDTLHLRAYFLIKNGLISETSHASLSDLLDLMFVLYPTIFKDKGDLSNEHDQ